MSGGGGPMSPIVSVRNPPRRRVLRDGAVRLLPVVQSFTEAREGQEWAVISVAVHDLANCLNGAHGVTTNLWPMTFVTAGAEA